MSTSFSHFLHVASCLLLPLLSFFSSTLLSFSSSKDTRRTWFQNTLVCLSSAGLFCLPSVTWESRPASPSFCIQWCSDLNVDAHGRSGHYRSAYPWRCSVSTDKNIFLTLEHFHKHTNLLFTVCPPKIRIWHRADNIHWEKIKEKTW